jgi:hypothetical protein
MNADKDGRDSSFADHPPCIKPHRSSVNPMFSQLTGLVGRSSFITRMGSVILSRM